MADELRVLLLPGWLDSGPGHWQTWWTQRRGYQRVEQDDWHWPRRGDWMARLEEVLLADDRPALLAAHSLGCHLVAAWAAHTKNAARVRGALLVAPPEIERQEMPPQVAAWRPTVRQRLPFAATLIYSSDDPYSTPHQARGLASDWGTKTVGIGPAGHINAESGLADWPQGLAELALLGAR